MGERATMGVASEAIKEAFVVAMEAALELGDLDKAGELLAIVDGLPPGRSPQFLPAQSARFRAQLAARRGDPEETERLFKQAAGRFRELSVPFYLAVTELENAEWLLAQERPHDAASLLAEAAEIFERLAARPWLERLAALSGQEVASLAP